jgi:hypothetical protein
MLSHNSIGMEQFAAKAHITWAFVSFMQLVLGGGAFWMLYVPAMYVVGPAGKFLFGLLLTCGAQMIFGAGGTIFHYWGYRDHQDNIKSLRRRR